MDPYQIGYQHGKQGLQTDWRFIGNPAYSRGHTRGALDALGYNPKKPWWWPF